jgi:rSAM/selenodomain-associated transferase 1
MADVVGDVLFIQFARIPVAGRVKTRMCPVLDPFAAMRLHQALVLHTAAGLCRAQSGPVELWLDQPDCSGLARRCEALGVYQTRQQRGCDLGERMAHALTDGLQRFSRVVLVGSDCPALEAGYLQQAVAALADHDVVVGPAVDGGYVLLGARRFPAALFQAIPWGSASVYAATAAVLEAQGWRWCALSSLPDIDRPADLGHCHRSIVGG